MPKVLSVQAHANVLEALSTTTAIFSALAWFLMPDTKVFPLPATNIACVVGLLANGNKMDFLMIRFSGCSLATGSAASPFMRSSLTRPFPPN
ncbi:hypothetical protein F5Y19DRAFT_418532 [Xylariaceae sp. FL1651]|nr:hypothetical protein F5Y19DRAFT_418532 [Xylariaceae sp. FL1651]